MNAPSCNLRIGGLLEEKCHAVRGTVLRIYLKLSAPPPVGWSYRFTLAWQSLRVPSERTVGIDGDAIWIECELAEFREQLLATLSQAVELANVEFASAEERKCEAERRQREREKLLRAELHELARTLAPDWEEPDHTESKTSSGRLARIMRAILGIPSSKDGKPKDHSLRHNRASVWSEYASAFRP